MSEIVSAAYSELTRVLPWSFRAQGLKFGHADRLSHLVMRAAVIEPELLALVAAPDQISTAPLASPVEVGQGVYLSQASDQSGIFAAAPLLDWLAARAADRAIAVVVRGGEDMQALRMLRVLAPDYAGNLVLRDAEGFQWVAAGTRAVGRSRGKDELTLPVAAAEILEEALTRSVDGDRVLLFWRGAWQPSIAPQDDIDTALNRVMSRGIELPQALLERFYALEMLTWAPTSERSRLQAGFVPKSASTSAGAPQ